MISVYTVAYNEEFQLPFLIDFYRKRFGDCQIIVYDNMSTDRTAQIAYDNNCEVIQYDTGGKIVDSKYLEIKNNCWKNSKYDWVCIVDVDEIIDINKTILEYENNECNTILKFSGYNMVNMNSHCDLYDIKYGVRDVNFDKSFVFNRKFVQEINYTPGCHSCNPIGHIKYSENKYNAYHFNFVDLDMSIAKYKEYSGRLSEENLKKGWGSHYKFSEDKIRQEYKYLQSVAKKVL